MSIRSCSPLSPGLEENMCARKSPTFSTLIGPMEAHLPYLSPLASGSNKPITYSFAHQLRGLVYYHIEECTSAQSLLSSARHDEFVNTLLVPPSGLGESTFYEANATRGSLQMIQLLDRLYKKASRSVGMSYAQLGSLVAIDGSLISACLSMTWADYRKNTRKAKMHLGFDLNQNIPRKMILTDGKGAERPFVEQLLNAGETGVLDRGYQDHQRFDDWIEQGRHFVARLKGNTQYEIVERLPFEKKSSLFFLPKSFWAMGCKKWRIRSFWPNLKVAAKLI